MVGSLHPRPRKGTAMAGNDHSLRLTRWVRADPETAFKAWTDPEIARSWSAPEGMDLPSYEADVRVGGRLRLTMRNEDGETFTAEGEYREVEPPRRVSYTWDWREEAHAVGETLITVEFADADGGTEVVMRHEGLPSGEAAADHEQGWSSCLDRFEGLFTAA